MNLGEFEERVINVIGNVHVTEGAGKRGIKSRADCKFRVIDVQGCAYEKLIGCAKYLFRITKLFNADNIRLD